MLAPISFVSSRLSQPNTYPRTAATCATCRDMSFGQEKLTYEPCSHRLSHHDLVAYETASEPEDPAIWIFLFHSADHWRNGCQRKHLWGTVLQTNITNHYEGNGFRLEHILVLG